MRDRRASTRRGIATAVAVSMWLRGVSTVAQETDAVSVMHVRIRVLPADAEVFVDGRRVENPADVVLTADGMRHQFEGRREGYLRAAMVVGPSRRSQRCELRLARSPTTTPVHRTQRNGANDDDAWDRLQTPSGTDGQRGRRQP